jgi:hypothetical protein
MAASVQKVEAFTAVVRELVAVLRAEIDHVRAMRLDGVRALQEPKARLSEAYAENHAELAGDVEGLKALPPTLTAGLRIALGELKDVVQENARRLAAARTVNERLMRTLAAAAAGGTRPTVYARDGRQADPQRTVRAFNLPMTCNRLA